MNAAALFVQPSVSNSSAPSVHRNPTLIAIMEHLTLEFVDYKYTVYRSAAKFVKLQKLFHTAKIPYKLVLELLHRHGIRDMEANFMVTPFQLTAIIRQLYYVCEKMRHITDVSPPFDLESSTAVLTHFFWSIFDPLHSHSISLLEIKVTFLLLCKLNAVDLLVSEFFVLVSDPKSKCVSKYAFEYLTNILCKIMSYIGEGNAYGVQNLQMVMEQCFTRYNNSRGLTEDQFHYLWTTTETRFLIYANLIALIKRIEDTEKLIHNNRCASCRCEKIIGVRFKCRNCADLSLCLKCFATGFSTNKHEAGHRMFETYLEDQPPKKILYYFGRICNLFCSPQIDNEEDETKSFWNANETSSGANNTELVTIAASNTATNINVTLAAAAADLSTSAINASNASGRLQNIIDRLLQQNFELEKQLNCIKTSSHEQISEFLSAHQQFLVEIINEMRNFSQSSISSITSLPTASTPNRSFHLNREPTVDDFSIIAQNLSRSINGADINRSYLEANKSDYSLSDLSIWFNQRHMSTGTGTSTTAARQLSVLPETTLELDESVLSMHDTEMINFKLLLHKVKEIVDDSYSDNTELAKATQNLESVVDKIIRSEESQRGCSS